MVLYILGRVWHFTSLKVEFSTPSMQRQFNFLF
jgi:hypothetical protein